MIPYVPPHGKSRIAKALKPIGIDDRITPEIIINFLLTQEGSYLLLEDESKIWI